MTLSLGSSDAVLTASATVLAVAPLLGSTIFTKVIATNTSGTDRTITLYRVLQGGSPGTTNIIQEPLTVPANTSIIVALNGVTLVNAQTLQGLASLTSVINLSLSWATNSPLKRSTDPAPFVTIALDPDVRPWLGYTSDVTDAQIAETVEGLVRNPRHFCFLTTEREGGYLFIASAPGVYVAHTMAMKGARGRPMLRLLQFAFEMLFSATDCVEVSSMVPDGNEAAAKWATHAGLRETFRREACFPLNGDRVGVTYRSLSYADWVPSANANKVLGETFIERLASERGALAQPMEPVHNAWVGSVMAGAIRGNVSKAVDFYNVFAAQTGFMQAQVVSTRPPTLIIEGAMVSLYDGALAVLAK